MTAPRYTRPNTRPLRRTCARVALFLLPIGFLGCGTATPPGPPPSPHALGANDPAWIVNRGSLPPPDTDRINYDERTRTVTLYDLPGNDCWRIQLPGEASKLVAPQFRVPDADAAEVLVYYTRPGLRASTPVTVKQIQECGSTHVSFAGR
ncbi:hypothetical protein [Frigoriglobus tundricola]|uniref:Lipoprotein n=1 Tax=Frigoriglobus tundricola TaxID=2774151 RepID=A0A6M5YU89_9BACT|nr:hypothetical protein [Frigoriglobus tundricola]QJW97628.1 hypothetical protein FTUN_5203 [Frigoriglobus tundricola]